jgi:hypothetical protein
MSTEIEDGLGTTITYATSGFTMRNTTIRVPPIDGGDPIDMTGLDNTEWRIFASRTLKTLEEFTVDGFFNEDVFLGDHVNTEQSMTITLPTGSTLQFYGYIRRDEPGDFTEGNAVSTSVTIKPTLRNPTTAAETAPVFTQA